MKQLLLTLLLVCGIAQADTTANLVNNNNWTGVTYGTDPNDCCSNPAGSRPLYDIPTDTIKFSYGLNTVEQVWAVNQALQNSGVQINGYNWSYELRNNNQGSTQSGVDTITSYSYLRDINGNVLLSNSITHNTRIDWTTFNGTQTLATPTPNTGTLGIQFRGNDAGYWAGLYGPEVRNVSMSLNYSVDQCSVDPQSSPSCPGFKTYYQMSDDGYARVDLPFTFPFYGQNYTTSYMHTNGVVGFLNNNWSFCCDGTDLNNQSFQQNSPWNYAIYALNTDLYPGTNSTFYTQQTDNGTGLRYTWDRVVEAGTQLENTFSVNINSTGYIGLSYDSINLNSYRNPLIGIAGNISNGEYSQYYFGQASTLPNLAGTTLTFTGTETTDICAINPLFSTNCAGYAQAYYDQQCTINALYDAGCKGYAEAYHSQQCSINQLYDVTCPGYAQAYLDYQCNLDSLYSTQCAGYAQAYYDQQCTLDPFYDTGCTGYQTAVTACTADPLSQTYCPGYQTAVTECTTNGLTHTYCPSYALEQQLCGLDPLSNLLCTGYATATLECNSNPLLHSYCPTYITTLAACSTDPQSNTMCPGYSTVTTTVTEVAEASAEVITTPSATGDAAVDKVINTVAATAPAAAPAAAVTITAPATVAETVVAAVTAEAKTEETKTEEKAEETTAETKSETKTEVAGTTTEKTETKKQSLRQQIAAKRKEAAMNSAVAAVNKASEELDNATSMAAQVAVQNVVMAAMGFTPGFQRYNVIMPDGLGYRPYTVYNNQRNVDNARTLRRMSGASDRLHQAMVDQQWESAQ